MDASQVVHDLSALAPFLEAIGHLLIPVVVLVAIMLFRSPMTDLIGHIRSAQGLGVSVTADPKIEQKIATLVEASEVTAIAGSLDIITEQHEDAGTSFGSVQGSQSSASEDVPQDPEKVIQGILSLAERLPDLAVTRLRLELGRVFRTTFSLLLPNFPASLVASSEPSALLDVFKDAVATSSLSDYVKKPTLTMADSYATFESGYLAFNSSSKVSSEQWRRYLSASLSFYQTAVTQENLIRYDLTHKSDK